MYYPFVVLFRYNCYSAIDSFFEDSENKKKSRFTLTIIHEKQGLNRLFDTNYQVLVTYGANEREYMIDTHTTIPPRMCKRWIHMKEINDIHRFNYSVNYCYIDNVLRNREETRPVFSLFTTCFNSYQKIIRAYDSIKAQQLLDWEWVILDDSPEDAHFFYLRNLFYNDRRVRLYRRNENNGSIGNVKNEAIGLCRGKYLLEMDHDDEILPYTLKDAANVFDRDPEVGFVYMDFINIYENGNNFRFGDFFALGYSGYYLQKYNNRWVCVCMSPNINNITLSHHVCYPNHPRMWRRETLMKMGSYSEYLPICDDFEILLRTMITTKIVRIHKMGYIQYMNDNNNNFSLIRNGEINRISPEFIVPMFNERFHLDERMKYLDAEEDEKYKRQYLQLWKRDSSFVHKYFNQVVNLDYQKQYGIIGLDTLRFHMEQIRELYKDPDNDFIVLDNRGEFNELCNHLDSLGLSRMKCYVLKDETDENLIHYFKRMYLSCKDYEIFNERKEKEEQEKEKSVSDGIELIIKS